MIKKLIVVFAAFIAVNTFAQQGTASPYSFYGIGSLTFRGTVENRSMGGLSIYGDSISLNLRNPAFYTGNNLEAFKNESRPVKFAVGGNFNSTSLKTQNASSNVSSTTFEYLALNIPVGKFGFTIGMLPFTSVGYNLQDLNDDGLLTNRYEGEGGLNKVFFGAGYSITRKLRVGVNLDYNFGNIENSSIAFLRNEDGTLLQFQTKQSNSSSLSGLNYTLGATYSTKFKEKYDLITSVTFKPQSNINSQNERFFSTITFNPATGGDSVVDRIDSDLEGSGLATTKLTLPSRLAFGGGIGESQKWFLGAEYSYQQTSSFSNPIVNIDNTTFEDSYGIAVGGYYIPDWNAFTGYLKRVVYRAGFRYETTGLNINNQSIDEFGITFGLGLPIGNMFSHFNVGFEYGQRGTTKQNLIKEGFFNTHLSLTLNERWFERRKYN